MTFPLASPPAAAVAQSLDNCLTRDIKLPSSPDTKRVGRREEEGREGSYEEGRARKPPTLRVEVASYGIKWIAKAC